MTFAAKDLTLGQVNALIKKMGGFENALSFLRDGVVRVEIPHFPTWKEVTVGQIGGSEAALGQLEKLGYENGELGKDIFRHARFAHHPKTWELIKVKAANLLLDGGYTTSDVLARARSVGLQICSPEMVFELCVQDDEYRSSIGGDRIQIPVMDSQEDGLYVELSKRDDTEVIWFKHTTPKMLWNENIYWVFVRPQ